MQIKTTMRYDFTLVRMAIMKKSADNKCWQGCGERVLSYTVGGNVNWCNEWIRKSILCLVTTILSFIWTRIELASQKISEHRARVILFVKSLFLCVCVCTRRHMNHDTNQLYMDHTQQPLEGTSRVICCPGSGVGNLFKFESC